ncbi:MAG TPA: deoxyribodipyrimidine photo-lyase [Intrasporangium sp.]|uniref:cryptochrome/photolyase family protein n=1 Tax=Intrasporangium sp. TaxID=1925024 RepID=UPI002D771B4A|nr:deoxyribodipyrimidine photo-lyase [Intrasporangium sp.]HET7399846.1 deoxyribodipyrimidine photo-lyase [Intrasporangium sp.]
MTTAVLWLRRDLRLGDHPALLAAAAAGADVLPLFVVDPALWRAGTVRTARLEASLGALSTQTGGALVVRRGRPEHVVPAVAEEVAAREVHVTRETTPYGRRRDDRVREALSLKQIELVETGTPYAVGPGLLRTASGTAYQVFTPFSRAWRDHGWPTPAPQHPEIAWRTGVPGERITSPCSPDAGEKAARSRWRRFLEQDLDGYAEARDRPDLDATSRMSVHLKYGEIHPRTMLADLAARAAGRPARSTRDDGVQRYVTELCWREFYADVLWHRPGSAWRDLRDELREMPYADAATSPLVAAWREGRTGYPLVDAGMRQLLEQGWMHNRLRMVTASFLVKDLHVWWPVGARHFLDHLLDGDLASNNHGWQWVAGTGTDAAPFFRVFNPVSQGRRFDPEGDYVRRWVPELAHVPGPAVHEPWRHPHGHARGYPERIVDHAAERLEALRRYQQARARRA